MKKSSQRFAKIQICSVIPSGRGGTATSAESVVFDEKIYCNHSGYFGLIRSLVCAFRLWFSNADVVNFHDPTPAFFYLVFPHRKKVVFTSHGTWVGYFVASPPSGPFGKAKAPILVAMQKFVTNHADAVVAVSDKVRNIISNTSRPKRVVTIHNGVDTKKFRPAKKRGTYALWVGNDPYLKGLEMAKEIAKSLGKKLLVVGIDGNDSQEVKYLGKIPQERMPEIYRKCSVLIYPSRWEGHPLVPLEAMASGLDIITSKESNVEIIPLRGEFYRVDGRNARKIAEKNTWNHVRKKYRELYESMFTK